MPCIDCPFCGEPVKTNEAGGYCCDTCGAREGWPEDTDSVPKFGIGQVVLNGDNKVYIDEIRGDPFGGWHYEVTYCDSSGRPDRRDGNRDLAEEHELRAC